MDTSREMWNDRGEDTAVASNADGRVVVEEELLRQVTQVGLWGRYRCSE